MKFRIAKWACAGPASPIEPVASILTRITCPIALLSSYPLSIYSVLFINAATYALVGAIVETLRPRLKHHQLTNVGS